MTTTAAVILAAGQGTRMRSKLPKVLHPMLGHPLAWYALQAAGQATAGDLPVMIVGHGVEAVRQALAGQARFALQEPQLGTGDAVRQAETLLAGQADYILVTYADMPLLRVETLRRLIEAQQTHKGPFTLLTVQADDPRGFGRIVRDAAGHVQAIVEEAQATPEQLAIHELNAGVYCFAAEWLWPALRRIQLAPKGEYYLTDLVGMAAAEGRTVQALVVDDPSEVIGINTRVHLAEAAALLRQRINQELMLAGVSIIDPATTYIEPGVTVGQDTVIWPNTYLQGKTTIGTDCSIGPETIIRDTQIANGCKVLASVLEGATLDDRAEIGPFGHLRKGAHLGVGVHMGNFGEVKNSYLAPGVKMGHFSYIGDAQIGENVNIGCGTITCNFAADGKKHPTKIGEGAFIGSDTMLIAPVEVGEGAITGSGSVVTKNVPPYTVVVGVPARAIRKREVKQKE
jgi:bifunctional UDP-N-acetylglucosamine pyrophosphorylase/glucosamine-1-phosphate N-acetyltransferase